MTDELVSLIKTLKDRYPEVYRHLVGLIRTILAAA